MKTSLLPLVFILCLTACSKVEFSTLGASSLETLDNGKGPIDPVVDAPDQDEPDDLDEVILNYYNDEYIVKAYSNKVDVFLVIDDSVSMDVELSKLADRLGGFTSYLNNQGLDWQICYSTTDVSKNPGRARKWIKNNQNGIFVETSTIVLNQNVSELDTLFRDTMEYFKQRDGSGDEQGIKSVFRGISDSKNVGCFRQDAALATIILSDEDERSCGGRCGKNGDSLGFANRPKNLVAAVAEKWPQKPFTIHSIVIAPNDKACFEEQQRQHDAYFGLIYAEASNLTAGVVGDICANDYVGQLDLVANRILNTLGSISLKCSPEFVGNINITDSFTVHVSSVEGNKVTFSPELPEGAKVTISYACKE